MSGIRTPEQHSLQTDPDQQGIFEVAYNLLR